MDRWTSSGREGRGKMRWNPRVSGQRHLHLHVVAEVVVPPDETSHAATCIYICKLNYRNRQRQPSPLLLRSQTPKISHLLTQLHTLAKLTPPAQLNLLCNSHDGFIGPDRTCSHLGTAAHQRQCDGRYSSLCASCGGVMSVGWIIT